MPKIMTDDSLINLTGPGNYQFSAVRPQNLGATEYTLASIILDISGSVVMFSKELWKSQQTIVDACKKSPRADNLLFRNVHFNHDLYEIHGFKLLQDVDASKYPAIHPSGYTALYDALDTGIQATEQYAKDLSDNDFNVNAIVVVVTDGMDNSSKRSPSSIKKRIEGLGKSESLESCKVILLGVLDKNAGDYTQIKQYLTDFAKDAGIHEYKDIDEATPQNLAKLAAFVSKSISSQSQSLGTGSMSTPLTI